MPIKTDLNVSPYFDDYNETKSFHRILFRPSVPVQARELTQLQTILQTQIERFGNWAFKNGDIVYGCTINDIPVMAYVRLDDFQSNGAGVATSDLQFTLVKSLTSNLQARVITGADGLTSKYPNTNVVYVNYINSGINGEKTFSNTDTLHFYRVPLTGNTAVDNVAIVNVYANTISGQTSIGNAHGISVADGVVYLNGNFVKIVNTVYGVVNNFGTYAGNNLVGFIADEEIITENNDSSLTDNALGYPNENAPGAHRLKLTPALISLDPTTAANTNNFNPIVTYNYGALVRKESNNDVRSIVAEAISTRVYEEAGNFVVNPFVFDSITSTPDPNVAPSSPNNVLIKVGTGIGYSYGSRVNLDKPAHINIRRGVDTKVTKEQIITFNYGNYFSLNEVAGSFGFSNCSTVYLYDTPQKTVTNRTYTSITPAGNLIGSAKVRCFTFSGSGDQGANNAIYYLHVFNVNMNSGKSLLNVKSVYSNASGIYGVGDINIPGIQGVSRKNQLFSFGVSNLKNLRDSSNNVNTQYVYRAKTTTTLAIDGTITVTIPTSVTGGVDQLPYGTSAIIDATALPEIMVYASANATTASLSGTVTVNTTSSNVVGSSTTFAADFVSGDVIVVGSDSRTVVYVANNTSMITSAPFSGASGGNSYTKKLPAGKPISFTPSSYIQVTNTTSFTFNTNIIPTSSVPVVVDYNVLRTTASPAGKVIRKNRFVKIDTTANPNGPWCLGFSDIHKINAVYNGNIGGTKYANTNQDVTNLFTFDPGQRDTHYDLGYLHSKGGFQTTGNPYLLVNLDYFVPNTTPGVGFFTVESYPIDDVNTSNTNAIQSKDIPLYVDESGNKLPLRDFVDFRPVATCTATDATTVASATENPSSTLTLSLPAAGGINVPAYNQNFQADYTMFLPRIDLIYMNPDNTLKIKEGLSALVPQTPIYPDNLLILATINVPGYPSLSSDQVDDSSKINSKCFTMCRDISNRITAKVLPNRRYTMKDIGKLDNRITNIEYYTQLSLLQQQTKDMTVTDVNGLDRFKNGIFVEPFSDFLLSDVANQEYNISIDRKNGIARPKFWTEAIQLQFDNTNSTNTQKTGNLITLPYTESKKFITQPYATKYRSASHVSYAWNGTIQLFPAVLDHSQMSQKQGQTMNMTVDLASPWQDFANSPMGTSWGGWQITDQTARSDTQYQETTSGTVNHYDLNLDLGVYSSLGYAEAAANMATTGAGKDRLYNWMTQNGLELSKDFVIGSTSGVAAGHDQRKVGDIQAFNNFNIWQNAAGTLGAKDVIKNNPTAAVAIAQLT